MKKWFSFKAEGQAPAEAEIHIFGLIGDFIDDYFGFEGGITTAKSFVDEMAKLPESVKTIRIRINSPGGDAMGGVTIANALRAEQGKGRTIETVIDGLAASAASIVAMGASKGKIRMSDNGLMMVHSPWSIALGNAQEMRATADILDQYEATLVKTYCWHSSLSEEDILALVHGEDGQGTWLSADDALTFGLADEIVVGLKAAASIDPRAAAKLNVPEKFKAQVEALLAKDDSEAPPAPIPESVPVDPDPTPAPAVVEEEPALAEAVLEQVEAAGLGVPFARALMKDGASAASVTARIAAEKDKAAKEEKRKADIVALCAQHKHPDLAAGLVLGGVTMEGASAILLNFKARLDESIAIDTSLAPDAAAGGGEKKKVMSTSEVYARRNNLRLVKE